MAQIKKTTDEASVSTPVKEEVKTTTAKTPRAKKTTTAKTTTKKTTTTKEPVAAAKTVATKAATTKATTTKAATTKAASTKTTTKKSPAKKTTKSTVQPEVSVIVEFSGGQEKVNEIIENIKTVYNSKENSKPIETLEVFIKPEERKAYFIVNGELDNENQIDVYF